MARSVSMLYNDDKVGGRSRRLAVSSCTVSSSCLVTTSKQTEDFTCAVVIVIFSYEIHIRPINVILNRNPVSVTIFLYLQNA
jgi:hypothetical protein